MDLSKSMRKKSRPAKNIIGQDLHGRQGDKCHFFTVWLLFYILLFDWKYYIDPCCINWYHLIIKVYFNVDLVIIKRQMNIMNRYHFFPNITLYILIICIDYSWAFRNLWHKSYQIHWDIFSLWIGWVYSESSIKFSV